MGIFAMGQSIADCRLLNFDFRSSKISDRHSRTIIVAVSIPLKTLRNHHESQETRVE